MALRDQAIPEDSPYVNVGILATSLSDQLVDYDFDEDGMAQFQRDVDALCRLNVRKILSKKVIKQAENELRTRIVNICKPL